MTVGSEHKKAVSEFIHGYIGAALWSSNDESTPSGGEPIDSNYSIDDVDPETVITMSSECAGFIVENIKDLLAYVRRMGAGPDGSPPWSRAGHDFWLTRNGHGVGFWDRGLGVLGRRLTDAAKKHGERNLFVQDGRVHQE